MPDDQLGIINTQPLGYKPHYEYIYKRHAYKLPYNVDGNIFLAMAMIYALINK